MQSLTGRQRVILPMIADGLSNPEIGRELHISEATVKTYVRELLKRIGARDRTHAVAIAYEQGLLGEPAQFDRRIARARVVLIDFRDVRRKAPQESRFAELYDRLHAALDNAPSP